MERMLANHSEINLTGKMDKHGANIAVIILAAGAAISGVLLSVAVILKVIA